MAATNAEEGTTRTGEHSARRRSEWLTKLGSKGLSLATLGLLLGEPCAAQLSTDVPPEQRTLPVAEQVEREMATARFRLGPLRLQPFFELYNLGWTNNALVTPEGPIDDYTASVSAGAKLILPLGQKVFLRGNVAPTYTWYKETDDLRGFGGIYSGELLALLNRLTVGAAGRYREQISTVSSEVARDVFNTTASGSAKVELKLLERLSLFAGAEGVELVQEDPSASTPGLAPASDLDRTEAAYRAGLRYEFSSALSIGAMAEEVRTRFARDGDLQDNDAASLILVARYDRKRLYVEGTAGVRHGKPVNQNGYFPEYRIGTYGYLVSFFVLPNLELRVLGSRRPEASLFLDNPYYFETRNGGVLRLAVGRRLAFNLSAQMGSNRYVNPVLVIDTGEIVTRVDDTRRFGGGFDFRVSRAVTLGLTARQERYDSNIDYYDRDVFRITGGISISADFGRAEERR